MCCLFMLPLLLSERTYIYNHILSVDSRLKTMVITIEHLILQIECVLCILLSLNIFLKQLVINSDGHYYLWQISMFLSPLKYSIAQLTLFFRVCVCVKYQMSLKIFWNESVSTIAPLLEFLSEFWIQTVKN